MFHPAAAQSACVPSWPTQSSVCSARGRHVHTPGSRSPVCLGCIVSYTCDALFFRFVWMLSLSDGHRSRLPYPDVGLRHAEGAQAHEGGRHQGGVCHGTCCRTWPPSTPNMPQYYRHDHRRRCTGTFGPITGSTAVPDYHHPHPPVPPGLNSGTIIRRIHTYPFHATRGTFHVEIVLGAM